jgi:hypothetical protein
VSTRPEGTGQKLTSGIYAVVSQAWLAGFKTKSDYARVHADHVAIAAALNLITTRCLDGEFGRTWRVAPKGLKALWERKA